MQTSNQTFAEEAIRPGALIEEMERLCAEDTKRLMAHCDAFVPVGCPACENTNCSEAFITLGVRFVECERCETIYANPRPSLELLHDFYANSKSYAFWAEHIFPASDTTRREKYSNHV